VRAEEPTLNISRLWSRRIRSVWYAMNGGISIARREQDGEARSGTWNRDEDRDPTISTKTARAKMIQ